MKVKSENPFPDFNCTCACTRILHLCLGRSYKKLITSRRISSLRILLGEGGGGKEPKIWLSYSSGLLACKKEIFIEHMEISGTKQMYCWCFILKLLLFKLITSSSSFDLPSLKMGTYSLCSPSPSCFYLHHHLLLLCGPQAASALDWWLDWLLPTLW